MILVCANTTEIFVIYIVYRLGLWCLAPLSTIFQNRNGVMVIVLASSVVDRGFEPRSGQTKDYEIGICCFFAKHAALRRRNKDWLARNQDNERGDMYIRGLLFQ
jgi:hypothetical protein